MADQKRTDPNAPVLVIGLGRFGAATAQELVAQGREVLAIEKDPVLVQKWASTLTHVVEADATDAEALRQLGAEDFSAAVVGVGTSIESSVLITVNLVDLEIPHIEMVLLLSDPIDVEGTTAVPVVVKADIV